MKAFYEELLGHIRSGRGAAYARDGETHGYRDLYAVAAKVARDLRSDRPEPILLYSTKSFLSYGALWGIMFSGNTWVPLSPELPAPRLKQIIKMTGARHFLSDVEPERELAVFLRAESIRFVDLRTLGRVPQSGAIKLPAYDEDGWAYIMFTSGSTGVPKGVPMTHGNYVNFIRNCMKILPFKKGGVFSDYHDWAFDISIFYLFCCPMVEGVLSPVLAQEDKVLPLRFMKDNRVTVWSSVPSAIARIARLYPRQKIETQVDIMFLCGEPFGLKVLDYAVNNMGVPHVYNFYGLTETGVENFYHPCRKTDLKRYEPYGFVPIGRPLPGNEFRVTREKELLLAGCQLTPGYLGGVHADRFEKIGGARWYHTGDIVEMAGDVCFCKGRLDSQVKLSGYRIELMDIEVNLKRYPGVEEAVCFLSERGGRMQLVAGVKASRRVRDGSGLRTFLADKLPDYMIPAVIFEMNDVPVNQNGKIDRKRVRESYEAQPV